MPHDWSFDARNAGTRTDGLRVVPTAGGAPYIVVDRGGFKACPGQFRLFLAAVSAARAVPVGPVHAEWAVRRRALEGARGGKRRAPGYAGRA